MKRTLVATGMCSVLVSLVLAAQGKPNFAGKWTAVDGNAGGRGGVFAFTEMTVTHDEKTLTVTATAGQMGEIKTVYNMDGTEAKSPIDFNGTSVERVTKAAWDGGKLALTTMSSSNGQAFETKQVWSIAADGTLTVESTRPDFQGGGAPVTTKAMYKKS